MVQSRREREKKERRVVSAKRAAEASAGRVSRAWRLPAGYELWNPKDAGVYLINIVGFTAGPNNPTADEGEGACCTMFFQHSNVGANKDKYACPTGCFGEPCPICEYSAELEKQIKEAQTEADKAKLKEQQRGLWASKRHLWLIQDLKSADPTKLKVWEVSRHAFGQYLFAETGMFPEYDCFADSRDGFSIQIGATKTPFGAGAGSSGGEYLKFSSIKFIKRDPLPEDLIDTAPCLDMCISKVEYKTLKAAFWMTGHEDENGQAAPSGGGGGAENRASRTRSEPKADDWVDDKRDKEAPKEKEISSYLGKKIKHRKYGICDVVKVSEDGELLRLEDVDGGLHNSVPVGDVQILGLDDEPSQEAEPDDWDNTPGTDKEKWKPEVGGHAWHESCGNCKVKRIKPDGSKAEIVDSDGTALIVPVDELEAPHADEGNEDDDWGDGEPEQEDETPPKRGRMSR